MGLFMDLFEDPRDCPVLLGGLVWCHGQLCQAPDFLNDPHNVDVIIITISLLWSTQLLIGGHITAHIHKSSNSCKQN